MTAKKYKVVAVDGYFPNYDAELEALAPADAELVVLQCKTSEEVIEAVRDADGVLLNMTPIKADEIAAMTKCKCISRYGIGYNNLDVDACTAKGIWAARVTHYGADESVSDQAVALLLDCIRKTTAKHTRIADGEWRLMKDYKINTVKGSTVGVIGLGHIGRAFVRKMAAFLPKEIIGYDPNRSVEEMKQHGVRKVELDELLVKSDFISVHCSENETSIHMLNEAAFSKMKKNAIVVNTARGAIIDEAALIKALTENEINSAGLDVFETEPLSVESPLRKLKNVVLADHSGWYSEETFNTLKSLTAQNVANVLMGKAPLFPLNEIK